MSRGWGRVGGGTGKSSTRRGPGRQSQPNGISLPTTTTESAPTRTGPPSAYTNDAFVSQVVKFPCPNLPSHQIRTSPFLCLFPFQFNSQCQHPLARLNEREQLRHTNHTDGGLLDPQGGLLRLDQLLHERQSLIAEQELQIAKCSLHSVCLLQAKPWIYSDAHFREHALYAQSGGYSR